MVKYKMSGKYPNNYLLGDLGDKNIYLSNIDLSGKYPNNYLLGDLGDKNKSYSNIYVY
jgi:hypothetical protein